MQEALKLLAHDGLVTVTARHGIYVAEANADDLAELSELRLELEGLTALLAAQRRPMTWQRRWSNSSASPAASGSWRCPGWAGEADRAERLMYAFGDGAHDSYRVLSPEGSGLGRQRAARFGFRRASFNR